MGSNLGDRRQHLADAVAALASDVLRVSSVYRTPPWGPVPQDDFYNIAVLAERTDPDPRSWLEVVRQLEGAAGRVRGVRWGPRTLDVDVIVVEGIVSADPELTLPHPRAHERAFVLVPWQEIEPSAALPGYGPIAELLADLDVGDLAVVGHVG